MTETQKQFEEWAKSVSHNMASSERADLPYLSYETQIAYEAWQASRAAIVVELPPQHEVVYDGYDGAELRHALKQIGVNYE